MALKVQTDIINPNGLNYLIPSLNEGDLEMKNFRCDSAGKLTQDRGAALIEATASDDPILTLGLRLNSSGSGGTRYFIGSFSGPGRYSLCRVPTVEVYDGLAGTLGSLVNWGNFIWCPSINQPIKDDGVDTFAWTPETPGSVTLASGGAGNLTGEYGYYMSGITAAGEESPLSPVTTFTATANIIAVSYGTMTSAPVGLADQVTSRKLYRIGGANGDNVPLWVADIAGTGAGTYNDNRTDQEVADDGIEASTFGLGAAPLVRFAARKLYRGRMLLFNSSAHPNRIYYSEVGRPHLFAPDAWVDIGVNEPIQEITVHDNEAWAYQRSGVFRLTGDELNAGLVEQVSEFGTWSHLGVASSGDVDYLVGPDGIYRNTGARLELVTPGLAPLWRSEYPYICNGVDQKPISWTSGNPAVALGVRGSTLYFSYQPEIIGVTRVGRCLKMDIPTGRWSESEIVCDTYLDEGPGYDFLGAVDPNIVALRDSFGNAGVGMALAYQSGYRAQGAPHRSKRYADLQFRAHTQGRTANVFLVINQGKAAGDQVKIAEISSAAMTPFTLPARAFGGGAPDPVRGFNVAPRVEVTGAASPAGAIEIEGPISLHYQMEPRLARTFDTGLVNLGDPSAIVELLLEIETLDIATLKLYTDLPGGTAALRSTKTIAAGSQRHVPLAWNSAYEGRLVRVTIDSTLGCYLWSAKLRVLREPEYLDGASGQQWKPPAVPLL